MTNTTKCPVWGTPAEKTHLGVITSERAGGKFSIDHIARDLLSDLTKQGKAILTTWISDQNRQGQTPKIDSKLINDISAMRVLSVATRSDKLLQYIGVSQQSLQSFIKFPYSHPNLPTDPIDAANITNGQVIAECSNPSDLIFLITALIELSFVEKSSTYNGHAVRLTFKGHARLAELAIANQTSTQAFVAMWFHSSVQSAYDEGVAKAIEDAGFKPLRIDRKEHNNKIDDEIIAEIRRSRFIVADMTCEPGKPRGGVYFEAGFAMGLNITVIWTCREDAIAEVHFDTRQFSHILWTNAADLRDKLAKRIAATIGDGPNKRRA